MGLLDFMNVVLILPPAAAIILISAFVSFVTAVVYKYTTDQKLMKQVKEDIKRLQGEIRATKEPAKAAGMQKEMMKHSMKQMSSSTKSMFITMIPLLLLFGWMSGHLAYEPIMPGEEFTVTAQFDQNNPNGDTKARVTNITISASEGMEVLSPASQVFGSGVTWRLKAEKEGNYQLTYDYGYEIYRQSVIVTKKFVYADPILSKSNGIKKGSQIEKIIVGLKSLQPFGDFSLFGYKPGWLATYIVSSLIFSMLVRKWLKLY